jgi:hypothetical protein
MNFMNELVVRAEVKCLVRTVTNRIKWTKNDKSTAADELEASIVGRSAIKGGECVFSTFDSFRWGSLSNLSLMNYHSNLKSSLNFSILNDPTSNTSPPKTFSHSHLRFSHFQCNSLNISICKQSSGVLFFSPFLSKQLHGKFAVKIARGFLQTIPQFEPVVHEKRITEFKKSQTKIVICMLEAS